MTDQEPGTGDDEPLIREDNKRITKESRMAGLSALFG